MGLRLHTPLGSLARGGPVGGGGLSAGAAGRVGPAERARPARPRRRLIIREHLCVANRPFPRSAFGAPLTLALCSADPDFVVGRDDHLRPSETLLSGALGSCEASCHCHTCKR